MLSYKLVKLYFITNSQTRTLVQ